MNAAATVQPRISFDDLGPARTGGPALLCLTGWCGDRTVFGPLARSLAAPHRTLVPDWRNHGESERSDADFGSRELLDDALAVIEAAGVDQIIPIALSHAGWVAIELRRLLGPERVPGI